MDLIKDWLLTFGMILVKPVPQTFITESSKAKGKFSSAVAWVVFIAIALNVYYFIVGDYFSISKLLRQIIFLPIEVLIFVFSVHYFYQKLFSRKKYLYDELLYLVVGIFVPLNLVSLLISTIPSASEISFWTFMVYQLILSVVAVLAITKLKIWQSATVVVLGFIIAFISNFILPALVFALMTSVTRTF